MLNISSLPWSRKSFSIGLFALAFSLFGLFVNLAQKPPTYTELSNVTGFLNKIESWNIKVKYSNNSGTDIYLDYLGGILRLNIGQCVEALNHLTTGDAITVKYHELSIAIIDGKVYEIEKGDEKLCHFGESIKESQIGYSEWWYVIVVSPIIGIVMIIYGIKT